MQGLLIALGTATLCITLWILKFMLAIVILVALAAVLIFSTIKYWFTRHSDGIVGSYSSYGNSKTINGAANLSDQALDQLTVNGALHASDLAVNRLCVNGAVDLDDCSIVTAEINGALKANDTNFGGQLTIAGAVQLKDCQAHDIVVKDMPAFGGEIALRGDTIVHGTIVFNSGKGKVIIYNGAQAVGAIVGGEIVRR